jgi:WD40 repeat protein
VAINSDGSRIFLTMGETHDYYIRMLDSENGALLNEYMISCGTESFALSPDDSYALLGCQSFITHWDIQNWRQKESLWGHELYINAITISQDGHLGLTAARDGAVRVWNLGDQLDYHITTIAGGMISLDITSDGKYLLLDDASKNGSDQPALWDILQSKVVRPYSGFDGAAAPGSVAISPDDQYIGKRRYKMPF